MTQDTKIILRELAIIHTTLRVIMEQQEALAKQVLEGEELEDFPNAVPEAKLIQTVALIKQRMADRHNLHQTDF